MTHALHQDDDLDDELEEEELDEDEDVDEESDEERVEAAFEPGSHPRAPAGGSTGGQFTTSGNSGSSSSKPSTKKTPSNPKNNRRDAPSKRRTVPKGQLGYDGQHGTGYDQPDDRVKSLQTEINRLGLTDSRGRKLAVDGKFGPLTTQAVEEAQRRLGMNPTGIISPAFIDRLKSLKSLPKKTTAAARDEPYGDVEYADPGYQADGKKRYPLDSEEHCRAAWSYINQAGNAAKYTTDQLARIKAKIKAAGKRYGIDFADDSRRTTAAALTDIELARPGTWELASGTTTFTVEMLQDAARYAQKHIDARSALKLGHVDPRFDGEPAFGWLNNADIYLDEDDRGPVLKASKVDGMPDWLAGAAPDAWPNRSVEGWLDFKDKDGETFSFVLDGLALLGVTPPGISSIRSLRDLPAALGVAASTRIVARAPQPTNVPAAIPAAGPVTAAQAAARIHNASVRGAGRMDPAKIREACGLPADASDDEVKSTLVAAGLAPAAPEPVAASTAKDAPGTMRVDASAWQEREERLARLEAAAQRQRESERDQVIAEAVKAGKFTPARREHWVRAWNADPEGARELIASLAANLVPVEPTGYADSDEDFDREFADLFPPTGKGARRG